MTIILKLIWPYLRRYMTHHGADYAADFLQARRERRLQQAEPEAPETSSPGDTELEILECPPSSSNPFLASDAFWYTLSGILLGSVVSIVTIALAKRSD
ncbi:MAG: hypothetical protein JXM69_13920 [Anaerolineae bacterium]|nr:hypothetical protein [Anaerolineae bacterium]